MALLIVKLVTVNLMVLTDINTRTQNVWSNRCQFESPHLQILCGFDRASSLICGNKMPTRCTRGFYCRSYCLLTCFGHHYAHHQELKIIIQWLLPVVFRAVVFKLLFWCGAEGCVSGLQDAAWS